MKKMKLTILSILTIMTTSIYGQSFQPQSKAELQTAVDLWVDDNPTALESYGEINTWDVSLITDMEGLFEDKSNFNDDISNWDVSAVVNMKDLFNHATNFNQDLSSWDVSSVTNMHRLFASSGFNGDISTWDVSSVTSFEELFNSSIFNGDISGWDLSSAENMQFMFNNSIFSGDISEWNVSSVWMMGQVFANSSFNGDISAWDVSNVTRFEEMFYNSTFNGDISGWDVSNAQSMSFMFHSAVNFNQDLSNWDVSNVINMEAMFDNALALTDMNKCAIHSSWSSNLNWPYDWSAVCNVIDFQPQTKEELQTAVNLWVNDNANALANFGEINSWDVSLISDMSGLFEDKTTFNDEISNWDVSNVNNMRRMFFNAASFNSDISDWDVSSVSNMQDMFRTAILFNQNLSTWNVSNVNNMGQMFMEATSFTSDLSTWNTSNNTDMASMFRGCINFTSDLSSWDVSNVTNMYATFLNASSFTSDLSSWNVSNVTGMGETFRGLPNFTSDLSSWDVSNVVTLDRMFVNSINFTSDLSSWDVSSVTHMGEVFSGASNFNSDLSSWDVSNVNNMFALFHNAINFNSDLSNWDVSNVNNMIFMFDNANSLSNENKCSIESTWSINENWPYDWSEFCPLIVQDSYSLRFDGDADYVETGVVGGNIRSGFSAEVSFKTTDINAKFLGKYGNVCGLGYANVYFGLMEGIPVLILRSNDGTSSTAAKLSENVLSDNEWHDIQVVYNGSEEVATVHTTIDGVQSQITQDYWGNEPILSLTSDLSQLPYFIGATDICHPAQVYYDGKLSKVKIYDQAVIDFNQEGALFDFSFSDGSGSTLFDLSGNDNHGTIVGASWDDDVPSTYIEGYVYVPDNNFEQALIDLGYDDVLDDYVLEENIDEVLSLHLDSRLIESLQGIEGFVSLEFLYANNNQLNNIALGENLSLKTLSLNDNQFSSLNISSLINLEQLEINRNPIISIDLSENINLMSLKIGWDFNISNPSNFDLDLTNNVNLSELDCSNLGLSNLNISNQTNLKFLRAERNNLNNLDLSSNLILENLHIRNNNFTEINLSHLEFLKEIDLNVNYLTQLDVSSNIQLISLSVAENQLSELNLSNNIELRSLNCGDNNISSIDISDNINLLSLLIYNNQISEIDLANNVDLMTLYAPHNNFININLSNNLSLRDLAVYENQLSELDITGLDSLKTLRAHNNQLTEIDLSNNRKIYEVFLFHNNLQYLNLANNNKLKDVYIGNNELRSVSFNNMVDLRNVDVHNNSLQSLGLKHNSTVFDYLNATGNPDLSCIEVIDERYHSDRFSFENGNLDEGVFFSTVCNVSAFQPQTKDELVEAVYAWTMGDLLTYGDISGWDVSLVTDMANLFADKSSFDHDISSWDVSNVTNMNNMFFNATNFNQDISSWDVSNVNTMSHMFVNASSFNQNIGSWDVSNVSTMQAMFKSANSFSQDLNTWDVSNVTHMNYMFEANNTFNGNIAAWNTSSVIGMHKMFLNANSFDKDISNWNVSNVTDMGYMFSGAVVFNQDLSAWNVNNVTNMHGIFNNTNLSLFNQCLIHNSWLPNPNWTYEWSSACSPVIVEIDDVNMDEDSELKIPLMASDPLNIPFYFETNVLFPGYEYFQAHVIHDPDRSTDTLHLIATNNYFGQAEVDVIVYNENGGTNIENFTVEIFPVDDLPVVEGEIQDIFVEEDFNHNQQSNWNIHLDNVFFDIDGELDYEVSFSNSSVVDAFIDNEHLTLSSIENAFGQTEMIITAFNPMRASVSDTVLVTVFPVNDAPILLEENTTLVTACHPYHIENGYGGNFFGVSPELQNHIASQDILQITQGEQTHAFTVEYTTLVNNEFCVDEAGNFLTLYVYIEGELLDAFGENLMVGSLVRFPQISIEFSEDTVYEMMSFEEMYNNGSLMDVDNELEELNFNIITHNDNIYLEWDGSFSNNPMIIPEENYHGPASLTMCVFDNEYDSCIEKNFMISPVNDAPEFHSSMDEVVGLNLEFHIDIHVDDVDSENVILSLGENSPNWVTLSDNNLHGEPFELGEFPIQLIATDGELVTENTLYLHVENFNPEIVSITDVPDDQGGRVYLQFNASYFDHHGHSGQSYNIYRHDDDLSEWVVLSSVAAVGDGVYIYEATTLVDSTSANNGLTDFWVKASMHEGTFESEVVSGYSVDNILPGVPEGVLAALVDNTVELTWNESTDEDFQYFIIEKTVNDIEELFETSEPFFLDENYISDAVHFYRIASVDHAGNQSEYSDVVEVTVLGIDGELIPAVFTLHQNYPNPFNPTTQIKYDLPEDAMVTINIYDVLGRSIVRLVNSSQNAGYHSLQWDAKNHIGEAVAAGMYIYTIEAGEYRATKKMVLLK